MNPGKTRYLLYRRLGGPQGRFGWVRKISSPPGFDPQTVQTIASRYTHYTIPAHTYNIAYRWKNNNTREESYSPEIPATEDKLSVNRNRIGVVSIGPRLGAGQSEVSFPIGAKKKFLRKIQPGSVTQPASFLFTAYRELSVEVKRSERPVNHSPPSSAQIKNGCSCTAILLVCLHGVV